MLRVLHIARSTSPAANAKAAAMARQADLSLSLVRPLDPDAPSRDQAPYASVHLVRCWRRRDPHRGLFRTLTFGMRAVSPHIIHAEEEPDSLAALHVAVARRVAAPFARLVLHTWQNVNRPKGRAVRTVLRVALGAADAVLCASPAAAALVREHGFHGPNPVVLQAGFDPDIFRPRAPERTAPTFTVGYAGRLAPEKGLDTLVAAFARLDPPAVLALAGTGPMRQGLERQAAHAGLGDRVRFLGALQPERVARFLGGIDVLVLPSRRTTVWAEQFGRVLAEAMACGTPVIGSRSGEIPAVIGNAGLLFPEGDVDALAARLHEYRDSPPLRARCSELGLQRARAHYAAPVLAEQTASVYRDLAATTGAGTR